MWTRQEAGLAFVSCHPPRSTAAAVESLVKRVSPKTPNPKTLNPKIQTLNPGCRVYVSSLGVPGLPAERIHTQLPVVYCPTCLSRHFRGSAVCLISCPPPPPPSPSPKFITIRYIYIYIYMCKLRRQRDVRGHFAMVSLRPFAKIGGFAATRLPIA